MEMWFTDCKGQFIKFREHLSHVIDKLAKEKACRNRDMSEL